MWEDDIFADILANLARAHSTPICSCMCVYVCVAILDNLTRVHSGPYLPECVHADILANLARVHSSPHLLVCVFTLAPICSCVCVRALTY